MLLRYFWIREKNWKVVTFSTSGFSVIWFSLMFPRAYSSMSYIRFSTCISFSRNSLMCRSLYARSRPTSSLDSSISFSYM